MVLDEVSLVINILTLNENASRVLLVSDQRDNLVSTDSFLKFDWDDFGVTRSIVLNLVNNLYCAISEQDT